MNVPETDAMKAPRPSRLESVPDRLTIKDLTDRVGGGVTPRMVRHYHTLGLLPPPQRSPGNYRLYTEQDVQRLRRIMALKHQGFQLAHIRQLLDHPQDTTDPPALVGQLQQQYQAVVQQIARLRQTATALEGILSRDRHCQTIQAKTLAQLRHLDVEVQDGLDQLEHLWARLDAETMTHPEQFQESLQGLLPDLSDYSEITAHLLQQLVLACGDVSLISFVRWHDGAIAAARTALGQGCSIVTDLGAIAAALDQTRLAHLGCSVTALLTDPHITGVAEAEQAVWHTSAWKERLRQCPPGSILVVGYAPSILLHLCAQIEQHLIQPALVIGMPIGFSHAPAAKRRLMGLGVPYLTIQGSLGGGLLGAVCLNALMETFIDKPDCHCYLSRP
jgi:precorrin-8X/cobalt-precorrin-8 methylmutase